MWAMSRRRKVAVGLVGTLVTLNGVYGGWTWLENTRLVNQITRETALLTKALRVPQVQHCFFCFELSICCCQDSTLVDPGAPLIRYAPWGVVKPCSHVACGT